MKCSKCGKGISEVMLHRTNPTGQINAGWSCLPCIKLQEPELAKNIQTDENPVLNDLSKIFYGKGLSE